MSHNTHSIADTKPANPFPDRGWPSSLVTFRHGRVAVEVALGKGAST